MKLTAMFILVCAVLKIMASCQAATLTICAAVHVWMLTLAKKTRLILHCGSLLNLASLIGLPLGATAVQAGIWNVLQCQKNIWVCQLIFMVVAQILFSRIMKMKLHNPKLHVVAYLQRIGFMVACCALTKKR